MPQLKCTITTICLCIGLNHALAKTHYTMQDFSSEGMLTFSIDLPKTGHEQKLIVRGEVWGLKSQVSQPQCEGTLLNKNTNNEWIVPKDCECVFWHVHPFKIEKGHIDASKQATVFIADEPHHKKRDYSLN
ncbi:hypothetical protein P2E05_09080 [Providencia stuartii]|uniref:hypothetical protein n=2 Tax=Morganellaceae TaxID=1903414 RepID=UPI00234A922F|nr:MULTISPECIES: hypothetical protein [unclassified Providencia]WER23987.1 hypothetical protein P2E04_09075 [Providencia stuartii]WER28107.1 hypothetical protein P2E05_09080 [Providencia stuartii]WER32198.1 hypothetical protein P2E06_09080 [Providencia stuartii]